MTPHARRIESLHEIVFHITILLAFFAALVGGGTGLFMGVFFLIAIVGAGLFQRAELAHPRQNKWWNILILLVLATIIGEYFLSERADPLTLGTRFVLILTLIKLFSRQGERDEMQIYALSFLTLAAASNFSEDFYFGLIFGLYVLAGTFGLALFHLKNEAARHRQTRLSRKSPFDAIYIAALSAISLGIFATALLIFFAFPRVGLGLFVEQSRSSLSVSGFSENISVGNHGSVRDNPSVVMRVEFDGERPQDVSTFKWRTMTFDTYDNGDWARSHQSTESPVGYRRSRNWDLDFLYTPFLRRELDPNPRYKMQIYLEPMGTNLLPVLWPTQSIKLGLDDVNRFMGPGSTQLTYDAYGDLRHTMQNELGLTYRIEVAPGPDLDLLRRVRGSQLDPSDRSRYLQLPDDFDPQITALATELTTDAPSNFEKVEAIGAYFFREFDYTLNLPEVPAGSDPVNHFLFTAQAGHCEYFASAAVLMLRSQGIPARMVNGFLGGDWNDVGDYLTVRQGDAHAWVELYVPEVGWVPFDATPPIESSFLARAGISRLVSDSIDAMRQTWMKWVIEYDLQSQVALLRQVGDTLAPNTGSAEGRQDSRPDRNEDTETLPLRLLVFLTGWFTLLTIAFLRARRFDPSNQRLYSLGLLLLATSTALWVGWFQGFTALWTSAGASSVLLTGILPILLGSPSSTSHHHHLSRIYLRIEDTARRKGIDRRPDQGPNDFLKSLTEHLPSAYHDDLHSFTHLYLQCRFGARPAGPETLRQLQRRSRLIRRHLQKNPS